ncbi:MAG: hypothetical protein VXY35_03560, partial [Candidatus Thermoplasmatota archaeon]|nr:hypothetical protein [Candidatus Thermoplasmatota archaeon]
MESSKHSDAKCIKYDAKQIIQWFDINKPLSGFGKMILGESLIKTGNETKGIKLIKNGFISA